MSVNQSIKPVTVEYKENIHIGGCDLYELAQKYKTPLYVIDEVTLRNVAKEYKRAFENYPNILMMYASKAFSHIAITRILSEEGFGFDVVSSGEIYTLQKAETDMKDVLFNGSNKSKEELNFALDCGIEKFSVDNFYEAELLNQICQTKNLKVHILLRITPGIECHTHDYIQTGNIDSKFGFDMQQIDGIITKILNEYNNLKLCGLHAHIGSQIFELCSFEDEIDILFCELVRINQKYNLQLNELNIGGGLGVKYTDQDCPPSIENFANTVITALKTAEKKYSLDLTALYIEPGRSVISTAGVTLYTVGSVKQVTNGTKYVAVDGGMADNPRPSLYQAKYFAEVVNRNDGDKEKVSIVGRYCESGDVLIKDIVLPKLYSGDVLCVYNTGAYNYSMASNYNKTKKPAMVLVNNSQSDIIVCRETLEDLVSRERIPDRLKRDVK